eukprot:396701-Amorphochlora_amoeboformis.AAC.1
MDTKNWRAPFRRQKEKSPGWSIGRSPDHIGHLSSPPRSKRTLSARIPPACVQKKGTQVPGLIVLAGEPPTACRIAICAGSSLTMMNRHPRVTMRVRSNGAPATPTTKPISYADRFSDGLLPRPSQHHLEGFLPSSSNSRHSIDPRLAIAAISPGLLQVVFMGPPPTCNTCTRISLPFPPRRKSGVLKPSGRLSPHINLDSGGMWKIPEPVQAASVKCGAHALYTQTGEKMTTRRPTKPLPPVTFIHK